MSAPRGLSSEEAALWARVAASVTPLGNRKRVDPPATGTGGGGADAPSSVRSGAPRSAASARRTVTPGDREAAPAEPAQGLDSHWERRLARASAQPDFTLDLHGHTLDQAHRRLEHGLGQAKAMGARLVLVVTGRPRPVEAADRGTQRGAIRAKILDWLAAGPHASDIAAIRSAHRRHGGEGALYLVLRRRNRGG